MCTITVFCRAISTLDLRNHKLCRFVPLSAMHHGSVNRLGQPTLFLPGLLRFARFHRCAVKLPAPGGLVPGLDRRADSREYGHPGRMMAAGGLFPEAA